MDARESDEDARVAELWSEIEAEEAQASSLFSYRPRFAGPSIGKIYWSERVVGNAALALDERASRAWDLLCDADQTLEPWFLASIGSRRGDLTWRIDDREGRASTRRTKTGHLTVYVPVSDLVDTEDVRVLQRYMLWTLTVRSEMDGIEPPPDAGLLLADD